jgi:cytidylate kinase
VKRARGFVVAIDGPAGAGKSTVSRRLADRLGYTLVDTGALYRAVALAAQRAGLSWEDGAAVGAMAHELARRGAIAWVRDADGTSHLELHGTRPGPAIRTLEIGQGASVVSKHPEVRDALLALQRSLGAEGGVVLEGRDIGTVVFPDAEVKVFLTASDEERARRRRLELEAKGERPDEALVLAEIRERDRRDSMRPVAPLRQAEDAVRLDTSALREDEVVDRLALLVRSRTP